MSVLVDTSVWIDHLRRGNDSLARLLGNGLVLSHPFVVGELACGRLRQRARILDLLRNLPQALAAEHDETLALVEARALPGRGIGWIDAHLLASALLSRSPLWTFDKALQSAAESLSVSAVS